MSGDLSDLVPDRTLFIVGEREFRLASPSLRAQIAVGRLLKNHIVIDESNKDKSLPDLILDFAEAFLPELIVLVVEDSNPGEKITTQEIMDARFSVADFLKKFMALYEVEKHFDFLAEMIARFPDPLQAAKKQE